MPTYEYECSSCGHEFEAFQAMTAGALKKCPACGKLSLKRLIGTGGAVIFKGSGFYTTDYRSESYQKAAKADSETSKTAKSEPAKTESSTPKKDKADTAAKQEKSD